MIGLADIPGSREAFIAGAWCATTVIVPALAEHARPGPAAAVAMFFTFSLAFTRAILIDIRDLQGDRMIGKETLPIVLGKRTVQVTLVLLLLVLSVALAVGPPIGWTTNVSHYLLACVVYTVGYLYLYHRRLFVAGLQCEAVVDGSFVLAGLAALAHQYL